MNGERLVVRFLKDLGINYIFTLPGSHINPIYDACLDYDLKIISTRHEQAAAFMADTYARLTRSPSVCLVTAGPGHTNTLTAVAQAFYANSPVLLISGHCEYKNLGKGALQEMAQVGVIKPLVKYSKLVTEPTKLMEFLSEAIKTSLSGKTGPVHLSIPIDLLVKKVNGETVTSHYIPLKERLKTGVINQEAIGKAIRILGESEKPIIIAGDGVWFSFGEEELKNLVEKTRIPVFTHEGAKGLISDKHELCFGEPSPAINGAAQKIQEADALLVLGASFDFRLNFGLIFNSKAKIIHVSKTHEDVGKNVNVSIGIVGDEKAVLNALLKEAEKFNWKERKPWIYELRESQKKFEEKWVEKMYSGSPIHPLKLSYDVSEFVDENTTVVFDGADVSVWGRMAIKAVKQYQFVSWGPFRGLGHGVPSGIASKLAREGDDVLVFTGDGSVGFNIMEFETAVRYGIPLVCIIGNDSAWGMVYHDQRLVYGEKRIVGTDLPKTRYEKVVEALGGYGVYIEDENDIKPSLRTAIDKAKKNKIPSCLNVMIKREMSPISEAYVKWRKSFASD